MRLRRFTLLLVSLAARSALAQGVTLPVLRSSKTPEMSLLSHLVRDVQRITATQPPTRVTRGKTLGTDSIKCDLVRLALAPYSPADVAKADSESTRLHPGTLDRRYFTEFLSSQFRLKRGERNVPESLIDIIADAPEGCELAAPSVEDVLRITNHYIDVEQNVELKGDLDSLQRVAMANVVQRQLRERQFFPVRSHYEAMVFWKQPSASSLNVGAISGSQDQGATFTELTSRFLHGVRMSLNTVISTAKDSSGSGTTTTAATASTAATKPSAADTGASVSSITRFLNGGGLVNVAAAYPAVHLGQSNGAGDFIALLAPRFGATLPILGASARDTTLMYDAGTELYLRSTDYLDGIGVFVQTRMAIAGGSPRFMTLIGDRSKGHTGYQTVSVGLTLDEKYLVTMSRTIAGPHALMNGWQIGVTLARSPALGTGAQ